MFATREMQRPVSTAYTPDPSLAAHATDRQTGLLHTPGVLNSNEKKGRIVLIDRTKLIFHSPYHTYPGWNCSQPRKTRNNGPGPPTPSTSRRAQITNQRKKEFTNCIITTLNLPGTHIFIYAELGLMERSPRVYLFCHAIIGGTNTPSPRSVIPLSIYRIVHVYE